MGAKQSQESSGSASSTPESRQRHATNASSSTAASVPSMGQQPSHPIIHVVGDPQNRHYLTARDRDSPDSSPLFPNSFTHSHHHSRGEHSAQSRTNERGRLETSESQQGNRHDRPPAIRRRPREYRVGNQHEYMDFDFELNFPVLTERLRAMTLTEDGTAEGRAHRHRHRRHRTGGHGSHSLSRYHMSSSVPATSFLFERRTKCPLCSKEFLSSELEEHLVSCVNKPRVSYNVDTLQQDSGECSICLDDMLSGDVIARLPCLCIYHIKCLKQWYEVSQTCPEHPEFINDNL